MLWLKLSKKSIIYNSYVPIKRGFLYLTAVIDWYSHLHCRFGS